VDIDQALAGIDKLLKSQELTFAFVGVAPAFAVVYLAGGAFAALLRGSWGIGKYGGKRRIGTVWSAMRYASFSINHTVPNSCHPSRRTERLLISQPGFHHHHDHDPESAARSIPPLTAGLLLLSVTHLRRFAETSLPTRSRLREGFLEDVGDLENPDLGRAEKMRVVERMWRCWGEVLGWRRVGAEGGRS
jgi:nuclear control of ATPase protein 2